MNKLDGYRASVKQKVDTPEAIEHLRSQMENGASEDCPD
jgi:hypothetical protein